MQQLHIVSLPHTEVSTEFNGCAYTQKVLKFCKMMQGRYKIFVYAPAGPPIEGAELIPCWSPGERQKVFGTDDKNRLPAWPTQEQDSEFSKNVIRRLKKNIGDPKESLILITAGVTHEHITKEFPNHFHCEPGVGYSGIFSQKCAFESYAWMHHVYGIRKFSHEPRWFDCVIPNYFDIDEFPILNPGGGKYILFLGRMIGCKGPHVASQIAHECGIPLKCAGAGATQSGKDIVAPGLLVKDAEYLGPVSIEERAKLLAGARCLIAPTQYIEPFGGVAVEAMMAGTPVVTTDWGAFTETVKTGVSGFRFRMQREALRAIENCEFLEPSKIRDHAFRNFSLAAVRPKFERWFDSIFSLWDKGWNSP